MRIAVVTGGSSGIGQAVATRLQARGWHCILLARGRDRLEAAASATEAESEICDVSDRRSVDEAAARIAGRHEAIHLLVNNAGIPARGSFLELPPERIEEVTRTNYLGGVWCTRAFAPLLERGAPSHVVNIVSVAGTVAFGPSGPYAAAKHAQIAFSRNVGSELAAKGVRVHTINPGPVETEGFPQERLLRRRFARNLVVQPDRVADAVVRAVEHGRTEQFVPGAWRLAAAAAALAPAAFTRLGILRGRRV